MNFKFGLMAVCAMAASAAYAQAPAPLGLDVLLNGSTVAPSLTGQVSAEFDGVAVRPDGTNYYLFDSIGGFDGIITSTGPAVFASESQLSANTNASAGDLDADATNLYICMFDGTAAKNFLFRALHTGFAGAVSMIDTAGTLTVNIDEIEVDAKNSRLMVTYNDAFGAATENIVHVPLTASAATPTTLVTETQLETALATIAGYSDDTLDDINVHDMTVQSDGDIIVSHGFSSNRQINGSLLRITETGTVSVFRTADQIITSRGVDPSTVDIGSVNVERLAGDKILIHVQFSSVNGTLDPFIAVLSADGTVQTQLATRTQLAADPDVPAAWATNGLFAMDGKGGDVASNGDYYFYRQQNSAANLNGVLRLTGINAFLAAGVNDWAMY